MPSADFRKPIVDFLLALTAAATFEALRSGDTSVMGTLEIGQFELTFLWALCGVLFVTRVLVPRIDKWWESRNLDYKDFEALLEDAQNLRESYNKKTPLRERPEEEQRRDILEETDLDTHLQLLGVYFFGRPGDRNMFRDMALLIKLMKRGDLKGAQKRWPKLANDTFSDAVPS